MKNYLIRRGIAITVAMGVASTPGLLRATIESTYSMDPVYVYTSHIYDNSIQSTTYTVMPGDSQSNPTGQGGTGNLTYGPGSGIGATSAGNPNPTPPPGSTHPCIGINYDPNSPDNNATTVAYKITIPATTTGGIYIQQVAETVVFADGSTASAIFSEAAQVPPNQAWSLPDSTQASLWTGVNGMQPVSSRTTVVGTFVPGATVPGYYTTGPVWQTIIVYKAGTAIGNLYVGNQTAGAPNYAGADVATMQMGASDQSVTRVIAWDNKTGLHQPQVISNNSTGC